MCTSMRAAYGTPRRRAPLEGPLGPRPLEIFWLCRFDAAGFERVHQLLAQPFPCVAQLTVEEVDHVARITGRFRNARDVLIEDLDLLDQPIEELPTDALFHLHQVLHSISTARRRPGLTGETPRAAKRSERPRSVVFAR